MVNITARVIERKRRGYLTRRQEQRLTNTKVLLFFAQSKHGGERGLFNVTGHL